MAGENKTMQDSPKIKIYVSCHKESFVPQSGLLVPIQVGTALAQKKLPGMLHDDTGDNISRKNKMYCELTAQYWVWKNELDADYIGFFHYRRYFNFSIQSRREDGWGNIVYEDRPDSGILGELGISDDNMERVIRRYDLIVPRRRTLPDSMTVFEQYANAQGQFGEDLERAVHILLELYPDYYEAADKYLNGSEVYECNMFIMKKELFSGYAGWLFSILSALEERSDFSEYSETELRTPGYIGERLFGIWYTHHKDGLRTKELQKTLFRDTSPVKKVGADGSVVLVLSCSDSFCPYLGVTLASVAYHSSADRNYSIAILTKDITEENRRMLKHTVQSVGKPSAGIKVEFIDMKNIVGKNSFFVDQHLSVETYFRLFIPEIFADVGKAVYLDCDLVVNGDVGSLYDTDVSDCYLAAARDLDMIGTSHFDKKRREYVEKTVGCRRAADYFQAGVLVLNLAKIRQDFTTEQLVDTALRRNWKFHDQDVLNHVFAGNIKYLPQEWNVLMSWKGGERSRMDVIRHSPNGLYQEYMQAREKPLAVHFAGYQKPWNCKDCDLGMYFWRYARLTPYYETVLLELNLRELKNRKGTAAMADGSGWTEGENAIVKQVDANGIRLKEVEDVIYVDGVMVKLINKFNRMYPIGSKKRDRLRRLMRHFVRS